MRSINGELIFQNFLKLNFTLTPITIKGLSSSLGSNESENFEFCFVMKTLCLNQNNSQEKR
jgi:hypothetical protein